MTVDSTASAETWRAYQDMFGFAGNELLTPMNRSQVTVGLEPGFWECVPVPGNAKGTHGAERLKAYADAAQCNKGAWEDDSHVPGMLQTAVEYTHLFIGPPSPAASPWETTNDPRNEGKVGYGASTVAMKNLLADAGMELSGEHNQYEDHMGVELLYLALLCERSADAFEHSNAKKAGECIAQAQIFAKAHPLRWMHQFRKNIDAARPKGYYSALMEYMEGLLEELTSTQGQGA